MSIAFPLRMLRRFLLQQLSPPAGFSKTLADIQFLLCAGEHAPFKSPAEVTALPLDELNYWTSKMSEFYKEQQRQIEQAKS